MFHKLKNALGSLRPARQQFIASVKTIVSGLALRTPSGRVLLNATRLVLLLGLSIAAANQATAQVFSVSGTVRDPNRKPLANVAVEFMTRGRGRVITGTDESGRYTFTDLAPGDYQVSFELAGYSTVVRTVSIKFDKDPKDDDKDSKEGDKGGDVTLVPDKARSNKR